LSFRPFGLYFEALNLYRCVTDAKPPFLQVSTSPCNLRSSPRFLVVVGFTSCLSDSHLRRSSSFWTSRPPGIPLTLRRFGLVFFFFGIVDDAVGHLLFGFSLLFFFTLCRRGSLLFLCVFSDKYETRCCDTLYLFVSFYQQARLVSKESPFTVE